MTSLIFLTQHKCSSLVKFKAAGGNVVWPRLTALHLRTPRRSTNAVIILLFSGGQYTDPRGLCTDDDGNFHSEFPPDAVSAEDPAAQSTQSSVAPSWRAAAVRGNRTGRTSLRLWHNPDKPESTWADHEKCRQWRSHSVDDSRATSPTPPPA